MLITNIRYLVNVREENKLLRGTALSELPVLKDAWLEIEDGKIKNYGLMSSFKEAQQEQEIINAAQASVLPCWCDSHTHLVFAGSREEEMVDKIKGLSYAEMAAKGGGILNSAKLLNNTSEENLLDAAQIRIYEMIRKGTGAVEIKSGYGLNLQGELKMLRVVAQLKKQNTIPIKATFLGAHAIPEIYRSDRKSYIDLIIREMLPLIAKEELADYIDVFCEQGFFTQEETEQICQAGKEYGLKAKIHANQLYNSGGVQAACHVNALSADHLEAIGEEEIRLLGNADAPISTLLPGAAFFLRMQYPPARELIHANAAVALASDYNPGSCPSGNMNLMLSLACLQMKMLPEEAINAATVNGSYAMEVQEQAGSITRGKNANLILTKSIPSIAYLPYNFGSDLIERVMINGRFQ